MAKPKAKTTDDDLPFEPDPEETEPDPEEPAPEEPEPAEPPSITEPLVASGRLTIPDDQVELVGLTKETICLANFGSFTGSAFIEGGVDGAYAAIDPTKISNDPEVTGYVIDAQPIALTGSLDDDVFKVDCTGLDSVRVRALLVSKADTVALAAS